MYFTGICEIAYEDKCYWVVKTGSIPYKHAESLCEVRGAMAANIYNEGHYQAMLKYIRTKMSIEMNSIWLGMVRDPVVSIRYEIRQSNSTILFICYAEWSKLLGQRHRVVLQNTMGKGLSDF